MIVPINEKYRIESGPRSWDVQKQVKNKGELIWTPKSFHRTLREALRAAQRRELREVVGKVGVETEASEQAIRTLYQGIRHNLDIAAIDVEQDEIMEERAK